MEYVRLPLLGKDYLLQRVDGTGLFEDHPRCKDYVIEALKFHLTLSSDPVKLSSFNSARIRPRQPIGLPKVILAIGGQAPKAIRSVECYDFKEERWFTVRIKQKNKKVFEKILEKKIPHFLCPPENI